MKPLAIVLMILALGLPTTGCTVRYSRSAHAASYNRPHPPDNAWGLYRGRGHHGQRGHHSNRGRGHGRGH